MVRDIKMGWRKTSVGTVNVCVNSPECVSPGEKFDRLVKTGQSVLVPCDWKKQIISHSLWNP